MLSVRPAVEDDVPALAELFADMDQFYGATEIEPAEKRERQIRAVVFGDHPAAHVLVANADEELVGFASYSILWPAVGLTQSLYLKELYVAQRSRGNGVGRALVEHLYTTASKLGCSRVEWTTDGLNEGARRFYESIGVQPLDKIFYRVNIRA